jgi:hypothetical protein
MCLHGVAPAAIVNFHKFTIHECASLAVGKEHGHVLGVRFLNTPKQFYRELPNTNDNITP